MQQVLALLAGEEFHQIQHAVRILAAGGDEVMGANPGAGGVVLAVLAVGGRRHAQGQVAHLRVLVDGGPGGLVEIAELAGIAEAEVHRAQLAVAEVGVRVVKVALDADAAVQAAGRVHLGQLLDDGLRLLAHRG